MGHGVKKPQMVHKQPGKKWPVTDSSQPVKGVRKPATGKTRLQLHLTSYSQYYNSKLQFNNQAQDLKRDLFHLTSKIVYCIQKFHWQKSPLEQNKDLEYKAIQTISDRMMNCLTTKLAGATMTIDEFSKIKKETTWAIDPETSAVLVIDMLNDFLVEGGKMFLPGGDHIVPNQKAVMNAARKINIPIIYINDAHRPGLREDREFLKRGQHCIEGSWGARVIDVLKPTADKEKIIDAMIDQNVVAANGQVALHGDHHMTLNMLIAEVIGGQLKLKKYIGPIRAGNQCQDRKMVGAK